MDENTIGTRATVERSGNPSQKHVFGNPFLKHAFEDPFPKHVSGDTFLREASTEWPGSWVSVHPVEF
jgi:hypothetical protein